MTSLARPHIRHTWISVFVIVWMTIFLYETFRLNYLNPLAGRELPKLPLLFPPAGWIMFYNIDRTYGFAEVYGLRGSEPTLLDPHDIFETRAVLYDNIHRNVLVSVLQEADAPRFCPYLRRKFPQYDRFVVAYSVYPDLINRPGETQSYLAYRCP